ncbi:LacI family DNA-binding transcriptional regulator [Aurantibacter aestuarii]|uniref:LacI family transcriptional regulator n=1 Tax=Aurantibacter aestuarii TaxID=1266046 RepID=A0A2T1N9E7_9FLAO|nr:LacI family DNA-binding transcriptional regulator [Aurantibacter aestuarii]PSG88478.1 LacI family transcriptional regulator [Aurantibacter aestuarii]
MSQNNITLKELAKILDVSISTISKALNDSHEISEATKTKIKELAKLHNYQPNKLAINLKSGKTKTIAVLIPSIQNYFFAKVLLGIESVVAKSPYNIIIGITNESYEDEKENLQKLSNGIVDGFILSVAEETQIKQEFNHFKNTNKPIVMFDRVVKNMTCDKVMVNDFDSVYEATVDLIKNNRKNIAIATTINNLSVIKHRIEGYKKALSAHLNQVEFDLIVEEPLHLISDKLTNILKAKKIDAIISLDEFASLAVLKTVKQNNFSIPSEIALIGYMDEKVATYLTPEFSTIDQNGVQIGEIAAKTLIDRLENKALEPQEIIIKSTINKKATTN